MTYDALHVRLSKVPQPKEDAGEPVPLTDKTMNDRLEKVLQQMKLVGLEALVIYGDVEHSGNFEYLTGFMTRFQEGLLVLMNTGDATLLVGNECQGIAKHCRIKSKVLHCPIFSLPNQPMSGEKRLEEQLMAAGLRQAMKIGIIGWKLFSSAYENNYNMFDVPSFVLKAVQAVAGNEYVVNATEIFIGREGVRKINNANEIAHYEYGSALASDGILRAMRAIMPGMSELEVGALLNAHGQRCSVVTICASGPRYIKGNLYPTAKKILCGDTISMTCGYRGGLASRGAYAVQNEKQLPEGCHDYIQVLSMPYYAAITAWLENIRPGMTGGELFALVDSVLPRQKYHWSLCPGHLTAEEEWLCSPVYENSMQQLQSGMLIQLDIIPTKAGYAGTGCENGVVLADEKLRTEIQRNYPELWQRMCKRRSYIIDNLGIRMPEWVLPLGSGVAYMRPYLLDKEHALTYCHDTE